MLRCLLIPVLIFFCLLGIAQGPAGSWTDHLPYHSVNFVSAGENEVYGATDYAISVFNKSYNELRKLSTVNGLSECGISTIEYSRLKEVLVIAYTSGNIDIYDNGIITNIPDVMNTFIPDEISANRIRIYGDFAYLLSKPGIIIIDIEKNEIKDYWRPSADGEQNEVFDLNILNDTVYAATMEGLFKAPVNSQGLSYYRNWNTVPGTSGQICNCLASADDGLFVNKSTGTSVSDSVFLYQGGILSYISGLTASVNYSFETGRDNIIICSGTSINIIDARGEVQRVIEEYGKDQIDARNAIISGDDIFIADRKLGLVNLAGGSSFVNYIPPGPRFSNCYDLSASDAGVWVVGGRPDAAWNNTWTPFMVSNFSGRQWWSDIRHDSWDAIRVMPVPGEPGHAFVSSWGSGLFEYKDNELIRHWGADILESAIPGSPYVRICGLAIDNEKNLWISQSGIHNNIKVLTAGKEWISLPYNIDAPTIGDIIISQSNKKWIMLPGGHGLFVLDDNRTFDVFEDDRYKKITVRDQDGKLLSDIFSLTEDLDGNIWIGTDKGPAVFYNPDQVFDKDIYASRIKVPRNDGSGLADYMLGTETILSIATDGGNRKWLGTSSSGAFLISESSNELIKNFNTSNSPLLSDRVTSVALEGSSGEVWFGTDKGIITVRETGTAGSDEMTGVYAYPNPVRENFGGNVIITGLARNSSVKITDVSGNLVYETKSTGGDASWDIKNYKNKRVSTGVYIVFCNNEDGSVNAVTKILVIR